MFNRTAMSARDIENLERLRVESARRLDEMLIGKDSRAIASVTGLATVSGITGNIQGATAMPISVSTSIDERGRFNNYMDETLSRLKDENRRLHHAIEILTDSYMKLEKKLDNREEEHNLLVSEVYKLKKNAGT